MPVLTVSISFDPSRRAWVVCRARTVVETHASRNDAMRAACEMAIALRQRMHCNMRLKVRDENDGWHAYALVSDNHSPAAMTLRLVCKFQSGASGATTVHVPESILAPWAMTKNLLARITDTVAHRRIDA